MNITLGLPHRPCQRDHGTGYALAGTGASNELSFANFHRIRRKLEKQDLKEKHYEILL